MSLFDDVGCLVSCNVWIQIWVIQLCIYLVSFILGPELRCLCVCVCVCLCVCVCVWIPCVVVRPSYELLRFIIIGCRFVSFGRPAVPLCFIACLISSRASPLISARLVSARLALSRLALSRLASPSALPPLPSCFAMEEGKDQQVCDVAHFL